MPLNSHSMLDHWLGGTQLLGWTLLYCSKLAKNLINN